MRRSLIAFVLGMAVGAAATLYLRPTDVAELGRSAGAALGEAGRGARHLQMQARVRTALALQKEFDLFGDIAVAAEGTEVTLSGSVGSEDSRELAGIIAKGVDGVDSVINQLVVRDPESTSD